MTLCKLDVSIIRALRTRTLAEISAPFRLRETSGRPSSPNCLHPHFSIQPNGCLPLRFGEHSSASIDPSHTPSTNIRRPCHATPIPPAKKINLRYSQDGKKMLETGDDHRNPSKPSFCRSPSILTHHHDV